MARQIDSKGPPRLTPKSMGPSNGPALSGSRRPIVFQEMHRNWPSVGLRLLVSSFPPPATPHCHLPRRRPAFATPILFQFVYTHFLDFGVAGSAFLVVGFAAR